MDITTILLLAGIIFILIAIVGGGFEIKEIKIPTVAKWARIVSGILGLVFCGLFFIITVYPNVTKSIEHHDNNKNIKIFEDKEPDVTSDNIKLIEILAKSPHSPPIVNDRLIIEFTLQNVGKNPIRILGTFVVARNPSGENKDFGDSNQNKTIQPQEIIKTKAYKIVDAPGTWQFGPCYGLDLPVIHEEENLCPSEWRRFPIQVVQ